MPLILRGIKGSPLAINEMDGNLTYLNNQALVINYAPLFVLDTIALYMRGYYAFKNRNRDVRLITNNDFGCDVENPVHFLGKESIDVVLQIIRKINSLYFDFQQINNNIIETGYCDIMYPNKIHCVYDGNNGKQIF